MSATHHALAYHPSTPPTTTHALRKTTTAATTTRVPRPVSKNLGRSKLPHKGTKAKSFPASEEDDSMGSSFLQFCAMCEKQIVVPNNSILYCSESCRRNDGCQGPSSISSLSPYNLSFQTPSPPLDEPEDILGLKALNIAHRQRSVERIITSRIPPITHDGKLDLDPSEWKPQLPRNRSSDAFQYLNKFHPSTVSLRSNRRPTLHTRSSTTASVTTTAPSLSHTPTTSTSCSESLATSPFEFRPLMPRHDPTYSASTGTKSIDLIVPHLHTAFSVPLNGNCLDTKRPLANCDLENSTIVEDDFGKRWVVGNYEPAAGSLRKLLEIEPSGGGLITAEIKWGPKKKEEI